MTAEQIHYLESIGITGALTDKVVAVENFYTKYIGCKIDDLFVSEYVNPEGDRVYENLWFFSTDFCYEAHFFMTEDNFDGDIIKDSIMSFTIKKNNFNTEANISNDNSRMNLIFRFSVDRGGDLKASKENCKQLSMIFKKYIQPNFEGKK